MVDYIVKVIATKETWKNIRDTYLEKGYLIDEVIAHKGEEAYTLIFLPPNEYGIYNDVVQKFDFDRDGWISEKVQPEIQNRLSESDYKMLYDIVEEMTPEDYQKWKKYRQDLRGIMETTEVKDAMKPIKVSWPTKPTISAIVP